MKKRIMLFAVLTMSSIAFNAQTVMSIYENNGTVVQIPLNTIDSITYFVYPGNIATLTTLPIANQINTTGTSGGNITNDGGTPITQRGLVWSTTSNPTTADNFTSEGSGTGSFSSNITGLIIGSTYYLRAYATNSAGTSYGNELSFVPIAGGGIISNPGTGVTFDGHSYSSIILGNGQEWMTENLRTTTYANGDPIPNVIAPNQWSNLTTGAWAHYNNDNQYENPYGKLYNWYAVSDSRNVCPTGWHVPSDPEWGAFLDYLDPNSNGGNNTSTAGGKMKIAGTQYWQSPNTDATNSSGFSGHPGGNLDAGSFFDIGNIGSWWSSTNDQLNMNSAWSVELRYDNGSNYKGNVPKSYGYSVRCLRD
jgi:uncharacterized protein (TIGR02145 family)